MLIDPGGNWWQDGGCVCPVCRNEGKKSEALLVCNRCEFAFHPSCHISPFCYESSRGPWHCGRCLQVDNQSLAKAEYNKLVCGQITLKLFSYSKSKQFVTGGNNANEGEPSNLVRIRHNLLNSDRYEKTELFIEDVHQMFDYHRQNFNLNFVEKLGIRSSLENKINSHVEYFRYLINLHFFPPRISSKRNLRQSQFRQPQSEVLQPFKCGECHRNFKSRWNHQRHIAEVHNQRHSPHHKEVVCARCLRVFGRKGQLEKHLQLDHQLIFICKFCQYGFGDEFRLRQHLALLHIWQ